MPENICQGRHGACTIKAEPGILNGLYCNACAALVVEWSLEHVILTASGDQSEWDTNMSSNLSHMLEALDNISMSKFENVAALACDAYAALSNLHKAIKDSVDRRGA